MNNEMNNIANNLEANDALKARISENKGNLKKELATYATLAKKLKLAAKVQIDAGKKFTKKQLL